MLTLSSDIFFLFGIALLPFENMFFAPSAGWGAIAPLVFVLYVLANIRYINKVISKYRKIFILLFWCILITFMNFLFINSYFREALSRFLSAFISLGLGIINLMAFDIYFIEKHGSIKKVERILLAAYSIALIIGFVQFIAIRFDIDLLRYLDSLLSKRSYLKGNRIQFTFTEPSFIGMHLFGVLLPIYIYGKNRKVRNLLILFAASALFFSSGVRIVVDILVVTIIFLLHRINFRKFKNVMFVTAAAVALIWGSTYIYHNNVRVRQIVNTGVYADGSFASRFFRINASVKGYRDHVGHALLGYGLGQEVYPLASGYYEAREEYKSSYLREVYALSAATQSQDESVSFCLFIRIASEGGLIVFLLVMLYFGMLYKREKNRTWRALILVSLYLYLQFESYAFYTVWLIIVLYELKNSVNDSQTDN